MNKYILFVFLLLALVSCRDRIDDANFSSEEVFQTSEQAFAAVDALYTSGAPAFYGQASTSSGPIAAIGGYLSGYFDNESKSEDPLASFCQHLTFDGNNICGTIDKIWNSAYGSIEQANMIIKQLTLSTKISDDDKKLLIAEARFFSAFNYFYLVRYFGGVPLFREGNGLAKSDKASIAEIYSTMISDLQSAIPNLSESSPRITPVIAKTLLCDIYLTASGYPLQASYYNEAAQIAKEIIQNSRHNLVAHDSIGGASAYRALYNAHSPELIYGYTPSDNAFATLTFSKAAASWGIFSKGTNNAYKPTKEFLNIYDIEYDLRAGEGEFFHTFYKYEKGDRTVIQSFESSPCIWLDNTLGGHDSLTPKSISIYRFAEVLLLAAEAIAHTDGVTAEAVDYIAQVRARAYHKTDQSTIVAQLSGLGKGQFIEEVWKERLRELPLEMKIWNDIQRTRKYPIPAKGGQITFVDIVGAVNPWGAVYGSETLLLPVTENIKSPDTTIN